MSEDSIAALFNKEVIHAPSSAANNMAKGLCTYLLAFKSHRESAIMNYESQPEYKKHSVIMQVPSDQLWPYTPHFRKFVALAIQELFKTKITSIAHSPVTMEQSIIYVDDCKNRWIMRMEEYEYNDESSGSSSGCSMNQIIMYFPLSNTPLASQGKTTPIEHLIDPTFWRDNGLGMITTEVGNFLLD